MINIITAIKGAGYTSVDGTLFCGDYSNSYTAVESEKGMSYVYNNLKNTWGSDYDTNGLCPHVLDSETGENYYLNYRDKHNLFILNKANVRGRIYLYGQVTDIETVSAYVDDKFGEVDAGSGGNVLTGDQIVIKVKKSDGTIVFEKINVYKNMLDTIEEQLKNAGVYSGLTLTYNGIVICTDYKLKVTEAFFNDYPEFPDEGAVIINKQLNKNKYNYLETGAVQIDLSVTGIPLAKGSDVIAVEVLEKEIFG